MQSKRVQKSIFAKLGFRAALLSFLTIAALSAVTFWTVQNSMKTALQSSVDTDIAGLADIYASGGEKELIARLADRQALVSAEGRRAHYGLAKNGLLILSEELNKWPKLDPALSEHGYVTLEDGLQVYARATRLSSDLDILVAREYVQESELLHRLVIIFCLAAVLIPVLVWAIGRMAAKKLAKRVARINRLLSSRPEDIIMLPDGDIGAQDEVGLLARNSAHIVERLSSAAKAQRHVTDHVAHEIRTPLLHLDTRLRKTSMLSKDAAIIEGLEQGREDIRRITGMLDSLLDIAASEARTGDLANLKSVDLSSLIQNILDLYEGSFEEAGLKLKAEIAANIMMEAEETQISRMISNLLDNSIKYAGSGSTLSIRLTAGPNLEISDDGTGIPEKQRSQIFERFHRGTNVQPTGHGLGLALVKAICDRHGLDIALQNVEKGTSFLIQPMGRP